MIVLNKKNKCLKFGKAPNHFVIDISVEKNVAVEV